MGKCLTALGLVLGLGLAGPAFGQVPSTQCVTTAAAGGTPDAITLPRLPCVPTTTLLILKVTADNATSTPTIQPVGLPAQVVRRSTGVAVVPGDLKANSYVMLMNNGQNWLLFVSGTGGATVGSSPPICNASTPGNLWFSSSAVQLFTCFNGQWVQSNASSGQGPPGPPGPGGGWTAVYPNGNGVDDTQNIQVALNAVAAGGGHGVLLDGGVFSICSTVNVPRNVALVGSRVGMYQSGSGANDNPWPGTASVQRCPGGGTFDYSNLALPAASMFFLHDNTLLEGFAISGTGGNTSDQTACVSGTNTQGVTIRSMVMANCYTGARFYSDGNFAGDQGNIAQEMVLHDNTFWQTTVGVDMETVNGGAGCTDFRVQNNEFEVPFFSAIQMNGCLLFQVTGNRMEDGNDGISANESQGIISSNALNNLGNPMVFSSSAGTYALIVANNTMENSTQPTTGACVSLSGQISGSTFIGNQCLYGYAGAFKADTQPVNIMILQLPQAPQGGPPMFVPDGVTPGFLTQFTNVLPAVQ